MKISYIVCIWIFLTEMRSTYGIETHGYTGKNTTVSCHHSRASTNRKYFCRDPCAHKDVLVSSDRSPSGRFSLKTFPRNGTFTVTITDLQESDSGIYWCGVDRVGVDTYRKVNLKVSNDITPYTTRLDTTQPLPTSTRQPNVFATSSRTSRSSTLEDTARSPSVTGLVNISLYAIGGLIAVIILVCGLVAVCQYRKTVKKTEGLGSVDHNEGKAEEATNVYENDLQDTPYRKVQRSQSHSIYENVELKPGQSDFILGNL